MAQAFTPITISKPLHWLWQLRPERWRHSSRFQSLHVSTAMILWMALPFPRSQMPPIITFASSCFPREILVNDLNFSVYILTPSSGFANSSFEMLLQRVGLDHWSVEHVYRHLPVFWPGLHISSENVCLLKIFCWKGWSNTDISLINLCGDIPTAAFWTISSFKELWVFVYFRICYGYAQTPMPSRKFYLQFCPFFVLTTGCRDWWSLSCQSRLLAGKIFTPLTELSDCCPQTKWAHMLNFPPTN